MDEPRNERRTLARAAWKRPEALVALCILVSYLLVWPVGGYVVEDDWAFSLTLRNLDEHGQIRILDWIPMTLVTHLFWGLLFTKLFGFHLTLLKISTVLLLAVEAGAVMALLRRLGAGETAIAMAGLTLLFQPLHFFQSFLYATDIPALAWSALAMLFYARGLEDRTPHGVRWLWAGSAFASLAWGVRQSAVLAVGALLVHLLLFERDRLKSPHLWAASFLLPGLSVVGFQLWYQNVHGPTGAYLQYRRGVMQSLGSLSLLGAAETVFLILIYAAFFVLPLALARARSGRRGEWRSPGAIAGGLAGLFVAGMFLWASFGRHVRFPYLRNKITQFGFLSPNEVILGARNVLWGNTTGWVVSVLVLGAAVVLAFQLGRGLLETVLRRAPRPEGDAEGPEERSRRGVVRFLFVLLLLQGLYVFLTLPILFDRHLLLLLPTVLVLLVAGNRRVATFRPVVFVPWVLLLAVYSIAGTHDLHAISRTAFRAGESLLDDGVDARFIDAGLAFDGWEMFERSQAELAEGRPRLDRAQDAWYIHNLMPRILTRYVVSLSPTMETERWEEALAPWARGAALAPRLDAYDVRNAYPYRTYWPFEEAKLYVLEDRVLAEKMGR